MPGPLGTPDYHVAVGHNRTKEKKHRGPPQASPELDQFKKDLIAKQVASREKKHKTKILGLKDDELQTLKTNDHFKMHKDVAGAFDKMWTALQKEYDALPKASPNDSIGVASTYRSAARDTIAWENAFVSYYWDTLERRLATGDEFGPEALDKIFAFMNDKKAPPGFSGHTHGIAADLTTTESGTHWKVDSHRANQQGWQTTWLYKWLAKNAGEYHFFQLKSETWHWEYHADDKASGCYGGKVPLEDRKIPAKK